MPESSSADVAHHEPGMVMFDLPPPLQCRGINPYEQTWPTAGRASGIGVAGSCDIRCY